MDALTATLTIINQKGLHARAAAKFVKIVEQFEQASVLVRKREVEVPGGSIMGLMMLGAAQGSSITLYATGAEAQAVLTALTALIENRFGEEA
jgi:phosphocarrier protein HPr